MTFATALQTFEGAHTTLSSIANTAAADWVNGVIYIGSDSDGSRPNISKSDLISGVELYYAPFNTWDDAPNHISAVGPYGLDTDGNLSITSGQGISQLLTSPAFDLSATWGAWVGGPFPPGLPQTTISSNALHGPQFVVKSSGGDIFVLGCGLGGPFGDLLRAYLYKSNGAVGSYANLSFTWTDSTQPKGCPGPDLSGLIYLATDIDPVNIHLITVTTPTETIINSINDTDIDATWTTIVCNGMCLDQTDNNILAIFTDNSHLPYLAKLDATDGSIIWKVQLLGDFSPGYMMEFSRVNGRIGFAKNGLIQIINTSDGSTADSYSTGMEWLLVYGPQMWDDQLGAIAINCKLQSDTGDSPTLLNSSTAGHDGWGLLYVTEAFIPPTPSFYDMTFSEFRDTTYTDWVSPEMPTDFDSFIDTWYMISDDTALWMEAPWLVTYLDNTQVNPALLMTPRWEWTESFSVHKTGPTLDMYKLRDGTVSDKRTRIRGKGRALQFRFESVTMKPFNLLGWSVLNDKNANY